MKNKTEEEKERELQKMEREFTEKRLGEKDGDMKNIQLQEECLEQYKKDMQKSISAPDSFTDQTSFDAIHKTAKENAVSKVSFYLAFSALPIKGNRGNCFCASN